MTYALGNIIKLVVFTASEIREHSQVPLHRLPYTHYSPLQHACLQCDVPKVAGPSYFIVQNPSYATFRHKVSHLYGFRNSRAPLHQLPYTHYSPLQCDVPKVAGPSYFIVHNPSYAMFRCKENLSGLSIVIYGSHSLHTKQRSDIQKT